MTAYEMSSFAAGQDCGTRVAAGVARLAALELMDASRWWNHWRRRAMARALVTCAEELESTADEDAQGAAPPVRRIALESSRSNAAANSRASLGP